MNVLYTAEATATGGRNGQVKSDNGVLDIRNLDGIIFDYNSLKEFVLFKLFKFFR